MPPKKKTPLDPLKKALKAMEAREGIQKLAAERKRTALMESKANLSSELQRLHGQAAQLPGLQAHVAHRREMLKVVKKKLAQHQQAK